MRSARRPGDRVGLCRRPAAAHRPARSSSASDLDAGARASASIESIGRRGIDFVAQEAVTLSTTPVWENGQLVPRPFSLRLLLARDGDGWQVMPGGFVRIADDLDARAINLQQGGRTGGRLDSVGQAGRRRRRCCRRRTASPSTARPARCRAAPPPTCSGSAAMSSAPRRRCVWFARWSTALTESDPDRARRERATSSRCSAPGRRCRKSILNVRPGAGRGRRAAAARADRRAAVSRRRRAVGGVGDPRPLLAGRLAGADRAGRDDQRAVRAGADRKRACSSASTARCASSRRSPASRRRT